MADENALNELDEMTVLQGVKSNDLSAKEFTGVTSVGADADDSDEESADVKANLGQLESDNEAL